MAMTEAEFLLLKCFSEMETVSYMKISVIIKIEACRAPRWFLLHEDR